MNTSIIFKINTIEDSICKLVDKAFTLQCREEMNNTFIHLLSRTLTYQIQVSITLDCFLKLYAKHQMWPCQMITQCLGLWRLSPTEANHICILQSQPEQCWCNTGKLGNEWLHFYSSLSNKSDEWILLPFSCWVYAFL